MKVFRTILMLILISLNSCISYKSKALGTSDNYEEILKNKAIVFTKTKTITREKWIDTDSTMWQIAGLVVFVPLMLSYEETRHYEFQNITTKDSISSYQYILYRPPYQAVENTFFDEGYIGFIVKPGTYKLDNISIGSGAKLGSKILPLSFYNCLNISFHNKKDLNLTTWENIKSFPPPSCNIAKVDQIYTPYFTAEAGEVLYIGDFYLKNSQAGNAIIKIPVSAEGWSKNSEIVIRDNSEDFLQWFNSQYSGTALASKLQMRIMNLQNYATKDTVEKMK